MRLIKKLHRLALVGKEFYKEALNVCDAFRIEFAETYRRDFDIEDNTELKQLNNMNITYKVAVIPTTEEIIELYDDAQLPRPTNDSERIKKIYQNSNLIISAWDNELLAGISRSVTDWNWSCYLADLAVRQDYQKFGIGKKLVELTKQEVGDQTMIILLSVPTAMKYYPKIGFTKLNNSFITNPQFGERLKLSS
ncbi:MAG: GNAT family N-acetyltransferase [Ginsengibacter sp.]